MLPAGKITEATIDALADLMRPGDVIIDGGNTLLAGRRPPRQGARRQRGIHYVDVGTSGGVWGLERGYCMMIGGDKAVVDRLDPIFAALAPGIGDIPRTAGREGRDPRVEQGYIHAGPVGAGHFVKMIHNGIEYGLMQAYAEGFDILKNANIDGAAGGASLRPRPRRYRRSVAARQRDPVLAARSHRFGAGGESGRWTTIPASSRIPAKAAGPSMPAIDEAVPAEVLTAALYARFRSRQEHTFAEKILSAMRDGFGGHMEPKPMTQNAAIRKPGRKLVAVAANWRRRSPTPAPSSSSAPPAI